MDEYSELDHGKIMKTTYLNIANQTEDALKKKGMNVTTTNIFHHLLSDTVILKISEHTTEQLVCNGYAPTTIDEFKQFLGTRWLRSKIRLSTQLAFDNMKWTAKRKGFILMDLDRYMHINECIRGFSLEGRVIENGSNET